MFKQFIVLDRVQHVTAIFSPTQLVSHTSFTLCELPVLVVRRIKRFVRLIFESLFLRAIHSKIYYLGCQARFAFQFFYGFFDSFFQTL
jgi:hypothetical protein